MTTFFRIFMANTLPESMPLFFRTKITWKQRRMACTWSAHNYGQSLGTIHMPTVNPPPPPPPPPCSPTSNMSESSSEAVKIGFTSMLIFSINIYMYMHAHWEASNPCLKCSQFSTFLKCSQFSTFLKCSQFSTFFRTQKTHNSKHVCSHTPDLSLPLTYTWSLTPSHIHLISHSLSHTPDLSLPLTYTWSLTPSHIHLISHSLSHTHTLSLSLSQRGICTHQYTQHCSLRVTLYCLLTPLHSSATGTLLPDSDPVFSATSSTQFYTSYEHGW